MGTTSAALELPQNLYLETTNRCNLRCKGCIQYRGNWEPERDMSLQDLIMITDQFPKLERVWLHGIGEPLLNQSLPEMIRHLKNRHIYVLFNTNGLLLDDERQQMLMETHLDELRISVDAATPEGYLAVRGSDQFENLLGNLRTFADRLSRRKLNRPKLSLWFMGTRENISELPDFIRLADSVGITEVYLQRLVYFQDDAGYGLARSKASLQDSDPNTRFLLETSQILSEQLKIRFNASGLCQPVDSVRTKSETETPWRQCYRPHTLMYITANGDVLPCCIAPFSATDYSSIIMGNVYQSKMETIWTGSRYIEFRKRLQTETPANCCRGCGILWSL